MAVGNRRILSPAETAWDAWFDEGNVSSDFMTDCVQPQTQAREAFDEQSESLPN